MNDTIKVWRVRSTYKDHGPFESEDFAARFQNTNMFPTPDMEGLPVSGRVCGCHTLTQLRHWFGRKWVVDELAERCRIYELLVPRANVLVGRTQVVFDRNAPSAVEGVWPMANILLPRHAWRTE